MSRLKYVVVACIAAATLATMPTASAKPDATIRLVTHDSFAVSKKVLAAFTKQTGIDVEILQNGDAGAIVNQAILTKDNPIGDVLFGVDNTFLTRALDCRTARSRA
jgi:thiamine transport system substrate-binding protein